MAEGIRRIPIEESSELGRMIEEAQVAGQPVVIEVNGHSYRLSPQPHAVDDPWKDYDPERAKRALAESAGALKGMDTERLKRELREQRGQDSHGRPA